jgi:uncharacterized protein (TIGR02099 family)
VYGVSAEVEFKNQGLEINANKGSISANKIKQTFVGIKDLEHDEYLIIDGMVDDDISGLYRFFDQSPLKTTFANLLGISANKGPAVVDLNIKIPLRKELKADVKAQATLIANTLSFPELDLVVEDIEGVLTYDKKGLTANSLQARVLGEKAKVDIRPEAGSTIINALGSINIDALARKYPSKVWDKVQGQSTAQVVIDLPKDILTGNAVTTVTLKSELKGIAVDLPKPIGKDKSSSVSFELVTALGQKTLPITLSYGGQLQGAFNFIENKANKFEFIKGGLHLGKRPVKLLENDGLQLSGSIDSLNVTEWERHLGSGGGALESTSMLNKLNLNIGKLHWLDTSFDNVQLSGQYLMSSWKGEISSPAILGQYVVPDKWSEGQRIKLELKRLRLPDTDVAELDEKKSPLSPDSIPNIDISSEELFIGDASLGQLEVELRQKTNGMIIQKLSLSSKRDTLLAKGAWEVKNGENRTGLNGKLESKSLGSLLKDVGVTIKLKDAPSDIDFDLHWPGEPQEFSKSHISGFTEIQTGSGRLLDVEPGIGRALGLLSLSTLKRRLQLDFSDLVQKGMSFDKVKGRFIIVDGEAQTNRFYLEGPSARLDFQGRVGLAKEDLDQLITVVPNTTESLPLAGALAGGPLVGAAVFLVQKIAGKTVNKFAGYQYHVTGSWSDPKIEQITQPGGKIFGFMGNVLTPVFDATLGQLPDTSQNKQKSNDAKK